MAVIVVILVGIGVGFSVLTLGGATAPGGGGASRNWCPLNVSNGIEVPRPGPTGNSSANGTQYYADGSVVFDSSASGCTPPYSFDDVFGDGTQSTLADVTHVYSGPGYYPGSITVSDSAGHSQVSYFCVNASNWPSLTVGSGNPAPPCP